MLEETASDPTTTSALREEIRGFIGKAFRGHGLRDDEDIFASGFVNSMFAMELITFIEGSYGITVETEDLDLDNFRSVARLTEFVELKRAATSG